MHGQYCVTATDPAEKQAIDQRPGRAKEKTGGASKGKGRVQEEPPSDASSRERNSPELAVPSSLCRLRCKKRQLSPAFGPPSRKKPSASIEEGNAQDESRRNRSGQYMMTPASLEPERRAQAPAGSGTPCRKAMSSGMPTAMN